MEDLRQFPQAVEAERAVLGGLLLDYQQIGSITEILGADDFYRDVHKRIFEEMIERSAKGEKIDALGLSQLALASGPNDPFGGAAYISSLPEMIGSTDNIDYYAGIVRERSIRRKLLQVAGKITEQSFEGTVDIQDLMDLAEREVFEIAKVSNQKGWAGVSSIVDKEIQRIEELCKNKGEVTGIPTGLVDLDRKLAGIHRSDLLILAARPAMGKTALALNIAQNIAIRANVGVGIFSLEMPQGQLVTRMLCAEGRVDAQAVRTGYLDEKEDWDKLERAAETLYQAPIWIDDTPGLSIHQIRSKARRLKAEHDNLGLIVIDYLQLMRGTGKEGSREQEISGISRGLKTLAKELDVGVVALSQLNRGVESRTDKRPLPSDLRESGAIEQDADIIMFIYRDEVYNDDSMDKGIAEVIVAKQRGGATGTVRLSFQGQFTKFDNLAREGDIPGGYA